MKPMTRALPAGDYWFEDLQAGDHYETGGIAIEPSQISEFARLSGDFFELHVDDEFARSQGFPARVAHGLLGLALTDGLKNQAPVKIKAVASLGWNWRFCAPIFAGDRISAGIRVASTRRSSQGKGIVVLAITVAKPDGEVVQEGETTLMVRSRPIESGPGI